MSAKKSFLVLSLILLIISICGTAKTKFAYQDSVISTAGNYSTAVNNKLIPNQRPADMAGGRRKIHETELSVSDLGL